MTEVRADVFLADSGYAKSRQSAKTLIAEGKVKIDGATVRKPSALLDSDTEHAVEIIHEKYVCRGGLKLERALEKFGIDVKGFYALDIGASTGGFTDCLLKSGAKKVFSIDSGHGQLDPSLLGRYDVESREGVNARYLSPTDFPLKFDIAVMDVSFISQTLIIPVIPPLLSEKGVLVSLIKPQFEAGRAAIGKNGIVKKCEDRETAILRVLACTAENDLVCTNIMTSPIRGGDGNTEYLACFEKSSGGRVHITRDIVKRTVKGE